MIHKYSEMFNSEKTLLPGVFSLIKALPDSYVFQYPKIRHPGAVLNRATGEIVEGMLRVLDLHASICDAEPKGKDTRARDLTEAIGTLFQHFDSFQDECYLILKSLCPPPVSDKAADQKVVHEWLKRNGFLCAGNFLRYTRNAQQFIDIFTNGLKHGNQRIDFARAEVDEYVIFGFFIDELTASHIRIYYPIIPSKLTDQVIAFSFNCILKKLLLCFYQLCDALEDTVKEHLRDLYSVKLLKKEIVKHDAKFEEMLIKMSGLESVYFPYEHKKSAKITCAGNIFKLSYPHGDTRPYNGRLKVASHHPGDGYTKTFHLPFFG